MNLPCDNPAILPVSERESMHEGFLQRHFDVAFAAPDGIKKLRELILTLAMQGKLVPQDPNDPPASELLKAIEAEKQRLVEEGKSKMPKPLAVIKPEEVPYQLPQGWEWVRLGTFGIWKSGSTPSRTNSSYYRGCIPWVKSGEVKQGRIYETNEVITQEAVNSCSLELNPIGSVLIAMYGANIGDVGILEIEATTNQAVCVCRPYSCIDNVFLQYLLISLKQNFIAQGAGAAQPNISREKIIHTCVPLPPLPEQHRIVAKIDQLMARCDELEKLRAECEQKRRAVHHVALKRLLDAATSFPRRRESSASDHFPGCADLDPRLCSGDSREGAGKEAFADAWQFITRHFNELYSVKENVTELRKAILQLAVMGKLVPQYPNDPPASELLKAIEAEKQRLVKEGKIKAAKPLPPIQPEEVPYELPQGWEWVRLDQLVTKIGSGSTPRGGKDTYVTEGIMFLRSQNIWNDGLRMDDVAYITMKTHENMAATIVKPMDILLNITGASLGRCVLVPDDFGEANVSQHVTIIRCVYPEFRRFIHFLLLSPYCQSIIWRRQVGMAREGLSKKVLEQFEIPLPPLPEQHRIVAKVDQLMTLCDTLENQIDAASNQQAALLNALMAQG